MSRAALPEAALACLAASALLWAAPARGYAAEGTGLGSGRGPLEGPAPAFELRDLDGRAWNLAALRGKPAVLVFGEIPHENTIAALKDIRGIVARTEASGAEVTFALVCATKDPAVRIRAALAEAGVSPIVLLDPERKTFGAYRVIVLPATVILDAEGRVVTSIASRAFDLADRVTDGILLATKRISREEFERVRPQGETGGEKGRALRLARLADRLAQRGFPEIAEDEYRAALKLDEECIPARVGYGRLLVLRKRIDEAEAQFRKAIETVPDSVEAAIGLASVEILRAGTEERKNARARLERVLQRVPEEPAALYLLGGLAEVEGNAKEAVDFYKRAAAAVLRESGRGYLP